MKALQAAAAGQTRQAEQAIQAAEKHKGFGHFHHTAYTLASDYAQTNRPQQAVEWLRHFACYPLFERDRSFRNCSHG